MRMLILSILLAVPLLSQAVPLHGTVLDAESGTPLAFANIVLKGGYRGAISNREGEFTLAVPGDAVSFLLVSYLGYEELELAVPPGQTRVTARLERKTLTEDPIRVTATRLRPHVDPVPLKNLDRETIEERYWAQDPPMLLAETPGIYAYNEAGNGIGNSYLTLRGFGQTRVSVMINGVPLNGGDSHEVWWVDLPDFAASLKDIQVQRGVMSGLYGSSALGGSINLVTDSFVKERRWRVSQGFGSWGTRKSNIEWSSGLMDQALSANLRLSAIRSDGYREQSWTRSWAYYLNLSHHGDHSTTRFNFFGGPENTHLAYKGITAEQLEDDRRANPLTWEDEEDRFHQPHFELHHSWQIDPDRSLANTLFFTKGDGYYEQLREDRDAFEYNLHEGWDDGWFETDLVRRRTVDEWDAGWIPQFDWILGAQQLGVGGELRLHDSHHFADVRWAEVYPAELPQYQRYYDYRVAKRSLTAYVKDRLQLTAAFAVEGVLQLRHHRFEMDEDRRYGVVFERDYTFVSPRIGLTWKPGPGSSFFASAAHGTREPSHKEIYWATDFWSGPDVKPYHFEESGDGLAYVGPEVDPEKVLDLELGGRLNFARAAFDWTLYWMDFRDEILPFAGTLDDNQYPNNGNAERSRHAGVELGGKLRLLEGWTLGGAANFTRDRFVEYTEYGYDWDADEPVVNVYDDQAIPGYPVYGWNLRLDGRSGRLRPWLAGRGAGRQWLDGRNEESRSVDPYALLDAGLGVDLAGLWGIEGLSLDARVSNVLDTEYETSGYIESDDLMPRWFVGAPRHWYVSLSVDF